VFSGVLARGGVAEQITGRAWLQALLDFEAALARAQARAGEISHEQSEEIAALCDAGRYDINQIGAGAAEIGNPAGAVVKALRAGTNAPVHKDATSQDAVDTAAMLVTKRALRPLLVDLRATANRAAELARAHRDTTIIGRTLLQQANPTTFGLKAAGWALGLDEAADRLHCLPLAYQLGGPVGTLDPSYTLDLGLDKPVLPWHTARQRVGEIAGALGVAAGTVGKAALDVILLSQTEVQEVREQQGGGSTSMPHKHNPVAAISALGCARQAPGLVATLLAAMVQEHERGAGSWHSEWGPLSQLLIATGSAASWLRTSLETLEINTDRMRVDGHTGDAAQLVEKALDHR
jgi:3-carboxy-cis,cis-muconate cycloisomerase